MSGILDLKSQVQIMMQRGSQVLQIKVILSFIFVVVVTLSTDANAFITIMYYSFHAKNTSLQLSPHATRNYKSSLIILFSANVVCTTQHYVNIYMKIVKFNIPID